MHRQRVSAQSPRWRVGHLKSAGPVHPRDDKELLSYSVWKKTLLNEVCITFLFGLSEGFGFRQNHEAVPVVWIGSSHCLWTVHLATWEVCAF